MQNDISNAKHDMINAIIDCSYCKEWYYHKCIRLSAIDTDSFTQCVDVSYHCEDCKKIVKCSF